ncbi:MAG TPA: hypothetical protein PKW95_23220 [bacterium]|nr:hypothetical protein [bacterium]
MYSVNLVLFTAFLFRYFLQSQRGRDNDSAADGDDDSVDDDTIDDDTVSDDDTTADDDTVDDDDWPDVCQNPVPGADDCGLLMFFLYCRLGYPIIIEDTVFTQLDAELACRDAAEPVWVDILECSEDIMPLLEGGIICNFVGCLADKGWPPQHTDIFDTTQWQPEEYISSSTNLTRSLNFWAYALLGDPFGLGEMAGAVVDTTVPLLRSSYCRIHDDGRYWQIITIAGDVTSWETNSIAFWMEGWYESGAIEGF